MTVSIHSGSSSYTVSSSGDINDVFVVEKGMGTVTINGFVGVGPGTSPSASVQANMDVLKFIGSGLDAKNMVLTVSGSDLVIQFEDPNNLNHMIPDTMVILKNFSLYDLDNIPHSGSVIGNILFNGQNEGAGSMFQVSSGHMTGSDASKSLFSGMTDNYDVANSAPMNSLFNSSTTSFLSEGNDTVNNSATLSGNDTINGMGGNDTIYGGKGDDTIRGGKGDDKIFGQDGKDILEGNEGKDTIYGGGNKDTIFGGDGNDVIYGDYGNKGPKNPGPTTETHKVTQKITGGESDWSSKGVTLKAYNADGSAGEVTYGNNTEGVWLGVKGETTPGPLYDDEIGYDPLKGKSEKLVMEFGKDVSSAKVDLTYFYGVKSGADGNIVIDNHKVNEVLHWDAFDNGNKVGSGDVINNKTTSSDFSFDIKLSGNKVFDKVEFTAKPYDNASTNSLDNGQGSYKNDSSDFGIKAVTICYNETTTIPGPPAAETEPGAADLIFGNAGNDCISGNEGDDVIHGDDLEHQATYGSQAIHLGSHASDQSSFKSSWMQDAVKITTYDQNGNATVVDATNSAGTLAVIPAGIGVAGNTTGSGSPDPETGYDPRSGKTEGLNINFGHLVLSATFGLSQFYDAASGVDQGKNEVMQFFFYREGELVTKALVDADGTVSDASILSTVHHGGGLVDVVVNSSVLFDEVKIVGMPYDNPGGGIDSAGQGSITVDSSDASLQFVDYTYRTESNPAGFDDKINGDGGNDQLYGDQGNDTIHGNDGNDFISGGTGDDCLFGDKGNDTMHGDDGKDTMNGGDGNDVMFGDGGDDIMNGDAGNDMMFGYTGNDKMYGGDGDDQIFGEQGNDYSQGGKGNDIFDMGSGNDISYGNEGNDTFIGDYRLFKEIYTANPVLYTTPGTPKMFADAGHDFFDGGSGVNTIDLRGTGSHLIDGAGPSNWLIHIDNGTAAGLDITHSNYLSYLGAGNIIDVHALSNHLDSGYVKVTLTGSDNPGENGLAEIDFVSVQKIHIEDGQIL